MADIAVGAALSEGFGLIRRRPLSVLTWGAILVGFQVATYVLFAPYYLNFLGALAAGANGISASLSPEMQRMQALQRLSSIVQLFVGMVIYCAAFRAVLHPERSSWAYLRLGAPEFFLAILSIAGVVALVIAIVIVTIPVVIVGVAIGASAGQTGGLAVGFITMGIVFLGMIAAVLFIGLRFALVGPMMVEDGKFHLFESWTLTRGRLGSLVLIGLALLGIFLVVDILLLALLIGAGMAAIQSLGGLEAASALLRQSPQALLPKLAPVIAIYVIVHVPLAGCLVAIASAPWARLYRDLLPAVASETFA